MLQNLRQPFERALEALVRSAAVIPGVPGEFVGDAGGRQVMTQQAMAPMQVVIVLLTRVEQMPASFRRLSRRSWTLTTGSNLSQRSQTSWHSSPLGQATGRST